MSQWKVGFLLTTAVQSLFFTLHRLVNVPFQRNPQFLFYDFNLIFSKFLRDLRNTSRMLLYDRKKSNVVQPKQLSTVTRTQHVRLRCKKQKYKCRRHSFFLLAIRSRTPFISITSSRDEIFLRYFLSTDLTLKRAEKKT